MKYNTYDNVAQKVSPFSNSNYQPDKHRPLTEILVQLGWNDCANFQEQLKNNSTKVKQKEPTTNTHYTAPKISTKNSKSPTKINIMRDKYHWDHQFTHQFQK